MNNTNNNNEVLNSELWNKDREKFEFVINEEYVSEIIEGVFETTFTDDQLEELFYERISEPIYCAIYDAVRDMLHENEQAEVKKQKPYYSVKFKNPYSMHGIFKDFTELQTFSSEAEAQAYIEKQHKLPYVEYRIKKIAEP